MYMYICICNCVYTCIRTCVSVCVAGCIDHTPCCSLRFAPALAGPGPGEDRAGSGSSARSPWTSRKEAETARSGGTPAAGGRLGLPSNQHLSNGEEAGRRTEAGSRKPEAKPREGWFARGLRVRRVGGGAPQHLTVMAAAAEPSQQRPAAARARNLPW